MKKRVISGVSCLLFLGLLTGAAFSNMKPSEYYVADEKIVAISPALDTRSVTRATDRFRLLYDTYLAPNDMHPYVAIVPDKSYYLADPKGRGQMDYEALFALTYSQMDYAEPIDLAASLDGDSYYRTDSHWRQECLALVAECITEATGVSTIAFSESRTDGGINYDTLFAADGFVGSYGEAITLASGWEREKFAAIKPDAVYYLTNDILDQAVVLNYDNDSRSGLYDWEKLAERNPYDFFLSGASALMYIESPAALTDRQLVVFRDSYGSSLIPLLTPYYQEILVVDIRYTMSDRLGERVDFADWAGADALYLYSTTLLNRSISLK